MWRHCHGTAPQENIMSDDKQLKQSVLDALKWEPRVNAAHIGVTAKAGIITLMGHVESYWEKDAAETVARRLKDVKAVAEELEVRLPFSVKRDDGEIAAAAVERLSWNSAVPKDAVKPTVQKGWITLTGEVDWHYQHEAAADDVRGLWGVTGLSNHITIKARPNTSSIKGDIMTALGRSWLDPETITVTAQDGRVKLTGTVDSWYERDEAGATAWAAPGTTAVQNDINVI
jgi:osmotically-inducible protein OsmY